MEKKKTNKGYRVNIMNKEDKGKRERRG